MNFSDPRAHTLPFTESPPIPIIILLISYYFLIKKGPELMKNRKPFELKNVMIFYNALQIFVNGFASVAVSFYLNLF